MWRPRAELKRALRRRRHRRRLPRARDRLLPRANHGITRRRGARALLHRLGRVGPQHDDHPLELPHARGRRASTTAASTSTRGSRPSSTSTCMFSQRGPPDARPLRARAARRCRSAREVNQLLGIDSRVVGPAEIGGLCPQLDLSDRPTWPIIGALYHRRGRDHPPRRRRLGLRARRRPAGRRDPPEHRGDRDRAAATAGSAPSRRTAAASRPTSSSAPSPAGRRSSATSRASGCPITTHILQAFVTEPVKPFLDLDHRLGADARLRLADRPRRVPRRRRDRAVHDLQVERDVRVPRGLASRHTLELFPQLERLKVLRTWTGLCDLSPDYSPILGRDRARELPRLGRLGHLRLQGGADRRHDARRARRHGPNPGADRALRARALPQRPLVSELAAAAVSH